MNKEEFEVLKQDMRVHGVDGVDPILVSPMKVFFGPDETGKGYVIVDGEHRWKAALDLGWNEIICDIKEITEEDAKELCYRRNRERGTIDPFKEALLFKTEIDAGLTQAKIAGKYGIEQGTVSHRLSILKIEAPVMEKLQTMPRGIITPSHLEAFATLHPKDQKELAKTIERQAEQDKQYHTGLLSVHEVQRVAANFKKTREDKEKLEKALETAKYPKCPKCKKPATRISYQGLPWVSGECYHSNWNLETGKGEYETETHEETTLDGAKHKVESTIIRSMHTIQEIHAVMLARIKELIPNSELEISDIKVEGKLSGVIFNAELKKYSHAIAVSIRTGASFPRDYQGFRAEEHDYRSGEKTCIHTYNAEDIPRVEKLIENAFNGTLALEVHKKEKKKRSAEEETELKGLLAENEELQASRIAEAKTPEDSLANEETIKEATIEE